MRGFPNLSLSLSPSPMASTVPLSPSPVPHLHTLWRRTHFLKPLKNPNFLLLSQKPHSLSSSYTFPQNLRLPSMAASVATHLQPLLDSTDDNLVEDLEDLMKLQKPANGFRPIEPGESVRRNFVCDPEDSFAENVEDLMKLQHPSDGFRQIEPRDSIKRVFIRDPPWITSLFMKNLYNRSRREAKMEFQEVDKRRYCS